MRVLFVLLFLYVRTGTAFPADLQVREQILYLSTWPHTIQVIDLAQEKVVDSINLPTDISATLVLSPDRTKLYASTMKDNCIVTIDLKTHKVLDSFTLNMPSDTNRLNGLTIDPTGKFLYAVTTRIHKLADRYAVEDPKFAMIDLSEKRITRLGDYPKNDKPDWKMRLRVSPNGKSLYVFRDGVFVVNTSDFKLVKKIPLTGPVAPPGMVNLSLDLTDEPIEAVDKFVSIFNASDPYVHRDIFGIAEFDLTRQTFELTPIGPAAVTIESFKLTPDHKLGYAVAVNGLNGNRVTEFWVFDMKTRKVIDKRQFIGRTRLDFAMSADGSKLLIYNAGFEVEIYDAKTLILENTINLHGDTTSNLIVMPLVH